MTTIAPLVLWIISGILTLALFVVGGLWRRVYRLTENDFKHVMGELQRIDKKLDQHIQWHLDGGK